MDLQVFLAKVLWTFWTHTFTAFTTLVKTALAVGMEEMDTEKQKRQKRSDTK